MTANVYDAQNENNGNNGGNHLNYSIRKFATLHPTPPCTETTSTSTKRDCFLHSHPQTLLCILILAVLSLPDTSPTYLLQTPSIMSTIGQSPFTDRTYANHAEYHHQEEDELDGSYADQSERQEPTEEAWKEMLYVHLSSRGAKS